MIVNYHKCLGGPGACFPGKFFDKNGTILCILSVPKLVIINLKINIFFINQQPKFCAKFFSKKYIHIKGGSGGWGQ